MIRALLIRTILTWLLLVTGFISSAVVSNLLKMAFQAFGPDYPGSLSTRIPASTQFMIAHPSFITNAPIFSAALGLVASGLAIKFASSTESRLHYLTLIAAFLFYVSMASAVMFLMSFFLMPKAFGAA